jgi:pimeloyl-ACP methyl ester carboxylesterase
MLRKGFLGIAGLALATAACGGSTGSTASKAAQSPTPSASPSVFATCYTAAERAKEGVVLHLDANTAGGGKAENVSAIVTGTGSTGIVLVHQNGENLCEWKAGQTELTDLGYRVLTFTMLGRDDEEVAAAAAELRKRGVSKLILIGASRGGTAALAGDARLTPPADGVVSLSAPAQFDLISAVGVVPNLKSPLLFAAADGDQPFDSDARQMSSMAGPNLATFVEAKDATEHGVALYDNEQVVHDAVLAFVKKYGG